MTKDKELLALFAVMAIIVALGVAFFTMLVWILE